MLQNERKNRGENVVWEIAKPLKNKGYEFPRTHCMQEGGGLKIMVQPNKCLPYLQTDDKSGEGKKSCLMPTYSAPAR